MDDSNAIKLLTKLSEKIPYLKQLNHDNQEYPLWRNEVLDTLEILFGRNSSEYQRFAFSVWSFNPFDSEAQKQQKYINHLNGDERNLESIIKRRKIIARIATKNQPIKPLFSTRTLSYIVEILSDRSDTKLRNFFFKHGLLNIYTQSGRLTAKERKVNDVFQHLCAAGDESAFETLGLIVREVLKDTQAWLKDRGKSFSEVFPELERGLNADGFQVCEGELVPLISPTVEPAKEEGLVERLLNKHGFTVAKTHLEQAYDNYLDGNWEASNGALRSFLQDVFDQIALILYAEEAVKKEPGGERRKLLQDKGFIEGDTEAKLVSSFFSFASYSGSHPGISSESDCRLRRYIAIALASYYLEKLGEFHDKTI